MSVNHDRLSEESVPDGEPTPSHGTGGCCTKRPPIARYSAPSAEGHTAIPLPLPVNELHLWQRTLAPAPAQVETLQALLSTEEQARARQFTLDRLRIAFITVRGTVRLLLGHYVDRDPASLRFRRNANGKPDLDDHHPSCCFNIAHSGQWGLYALSRDTAVGVDLEEIRPAAPEKRLQLARRFFSPAEYAALSRLPVEQMNTAFFACWSRKEAYIKCHGLSIARLLNRFTVGVDPGQPASLLETPWQPTDVTQCQLHDLPAPEGYRAALALASIEPFTLRYYRWMESEDGTGR